MNHLFLVRHGENTANLTLEFSYRLVDYSLTPKGVLQARQTADFLSAKNIQEIYTSPLKRALETAQIIAAPLGLPVQAMEQFREVNVGDLEGQKPTAELWKQHNAIVKSWMDGHPELRFPGGEDLYTLLNRARAGYMQILAGKQSRNIVIVAHGGIFRFTLQHLFALVDPAILNQGTPNCAITEVEAQVTGDHLEGRLISFASTSHLSGEAANLVSGVPGEAILKTST